MSEDNVPPLADVEEKDVEKFYDPVTGEQISKTAFKKLAKAKPTKEKKEKPVAVIKKEKVVKIKEPEEIWVDTTPSGEKKIIDGVFPSAYQPKYVEAAWQAWWEKQGYYTPNVEEALKREDKDKFIMVIPPPNVTGWFLVDTLYVIPVDSF